VKVLITGAAGQVGRALLKTIPATSTAIASTRAQLDISDAQAVMNVVQSERPDLIISAGAYTAVDKAESEPQAAERANSVGPGISPWRRAIVVRVCCTFRLILCLTAGLAALSD